MLEFKTRLGENVRSGDLRDMQKVYFTCHPADFSSCCPYFTKMILREQDCAVFYDRDEGEYEDAGAELEGMQLFVIPVTQRLVYMRSRTVDFDLPF